MAKGKNEAFLKDISIRVKQLRTERNYTQADVFNDTGINIGRIERGVRDFNMTTLRAICDHFNISTSDFFKDI